MSFKLSNVKEVNFEQNMTFSDFLEQFQNYASPLICLVDNKLHIYDKKENIPKNIHPISNDGNKYYYEDLEHKYTIFGNEAAKLFYPIGQPKIKKPIIIEYKEDLNLIIYDKGVKYEFPRSNKLLEIKKVKIF